MKLPKTLPRPRRLIAGLRKSALLKAMPTSALARLLRDAQEVNVRAGEVLQRHDKPVTALHVLIAGTLHLLTESRRGLSQAHELHPVSAFGIRELATGAVAEGDVVAVTDARLLRVDAAHFEALLRGNTAFRRSLRAADHPHSRQVRAATDGHDSGHAEIVATCAPPGWSQSDVVDHLAFRMTTDFGDHVLRLTVDPSLAPGDVRGRGWPAPGRVATRRVGADPTAVMAHRAMKRLLHEADYLLVVDQDAPQASQQAWRGAATRAAVIELPDRATDATGLHDQAEIRAAYVLPPAGTSQRKVLPYPRCRMRLQSWDLKGDPAALTGEPLEAMARLARWVSDRSVGLALGGGGALGYAHVALIEEICARGIPIDVVSGVSFGSMAGAYYCYAGLKGLDTLIAGGNRFNYMLPLAAFSAEVIAWQVRHDLGDIWLDELTPVFLPVACDIATGETVAIRGTTLDWGVRASGSFPAVFAPTIGNDPVAEQWRRFVDGGISDNVPEACLIDAGIDLVVSSNIIPPPPPRHVRPAVLAPRLSLFLRGLDPVGRLSDAWRSTFTLFHAVGDAGAFGSDVLFDAVPLGYLPTDFKSAEGIRDGSRELAGRTADEVLIRWRAMCPRRRS